MNRCVSIMTSDHMKTEAGLTSETSSILNKGTLTKRCVSITERNQIKTEEDLTSETSNTLHAPRAVNVFQNE
jgi:hypothetical protein